MSKFNDSNIYNSINLNLLKYFVTSAESKSFAEAGEKLGYSTPTVSTSISTLENQLGVKLFTRNPLQLTAEGKSIYETVKKAFEYLDFASDIANAKNGLEYGKINIGCPSHISDFYLMEKIVQATKEYPKIQITVDTESDSTKIIESLRNNKINFALLDVIPIQFINELEIKEIKTIDNVFVYNKDIKIEDIKDLEKYNFILSFDDRISTIKLLEILEKYNVNVNTTIKCPTTEQRIKAATLGGGITYVMKEAAKQQLKNKELFELKVPIELPKGSIKLVYLKNHLTKVDKEFIKKYIKDT